MSNYNMSFVSHIHNDDFNVLWEGCKADILSEDSFPWSLHEATTEEEKKEALRSLFKLYASDSERVVGRITKDLKIVCYFGSFIKNGVLTHTIMLIGPDSNNSKAWIYDPDWNTCREAFHKENSITRINFMLLNNNTAAKSYLDTRNTTDTDFLKTQSEVQEDGTILYINDL